MKKYQHVIITILVMVILFMAIRLYISGNFIKDGNVDADAIFSQYLAGKIKEKENVQNSQSLISYYIQNLAQAKNIVDNMTGLDSVKSKDQKDTIAQLTEFGTDVLLKDNQIHTLVSSDSAEQTNIAKASIKISNSILNEFNHYEQLYTANNIITNWQSYSSAYFDCIRQKEFISHRNNVSNIIQQQSDMLNNINNSYKTSTASLDSLINHVNDTQKKVTENSRDTLLITMVIPIFACMLAIIIFIPYFLRKDPNLYNKILDDKILIQVFTIFILVISILLLGIGNKLSGETLGTLLGGISVYVLQKSMETNGTTKPPGAV